MPSPWAERLTLGDDLPCHRCKMTGKVRAPSLTKADRDARRYENLRRASRGEPVLPRPPAMAACPVCGGRGTVKNSPVTNADPTPWEM